MRWKAPARRPPGSRILSPSGSARPAKPCAHAPAGLCARRIFPTEDAGDNVRRVSEIARVSFDKERPEAVSGRGQAFVITQEEASGKGGDEQVEWLARHRQVGAELRAAAGGLLEDVPGGQAAAEVRPDLVIGHADRPRGADGNRRDEGRPARREVHARRGTEGRPTIGGDGERDLVVLASVEPGVLPDDVEVSG